MERDRVVDEPGNLSREPRAGCGEPRAAKAPLALGKPPLEVLERLFADLPIRDPRVIMGPQIGEDAAVLDIGDRYLIAKVDPITFVAEEIGWYAVHINANDLAVRGARPAWFLMTLLLPEGQADEGLLADIFTQVRDACGAVGASLVGGHTEVTSGLDRPILAGTMLGEVEKDRLVTTAGARVGDAVLLSKGIAIEGASILAREFGELLRERGIDSGTLERAREFVRRPGISVLPDARAAVAASPVHAMHDPTEGGLATGLWELARAARVGLSLDRDAMAILAECRVLCEALGIDPLGLIASGALLLTCPKTAIARILTAWASQGIDGTVIGEVTPPEEGCRLRWRGGEGPLPRFARDEVARLFDERCPAPQA
jgi:hydrogenase expression/formation protein HypE